MKSERIQFTGSQGVRLTARLDMPDSAEPSSYALFAHCFTCTKNLKAVGNITQAMTEAGIAVFRFDFTGLGESEGDFADTNFSSNVDDLLAAAKHLAADYRNPMIMIGHSLGGAAVIQAARSIDSVKAVATIAAPAEPAYIEHLLRSAKDEIEQKGIADVNIGGRTFSIKKQFIEDISDQNMQEAIFNLNRALLIFHSPKDRTVEIDNAAKIFSRARHPKSFISLDNADHLLSDEEDSRYTGKMTATWAAKYI